MTDIRILLTDKAIAQLPAATTDRYLVRDTELRGFFVVVGKRKKTFTIQADLRQGGKRASTLRIAIGDSDELSTRSARATAKEYLAQISRGKHPLGDTGSAKSRGEPAVEAAAGITLTEAWERYRDAHMVRKGRSERTIDSYRDHVERLFRDWCERPLRELADDPALIAKKHDELTAENGPYIANGGMRTLRAIYNHARKTNRDLPPDNPASAIDWNSEERRNSGMGAADLRAWFYELAKLDNPIRREYHLFTLLSGCRPTALMEVKPEHVNLRRRLVHIPRPKGGAKRAFDIPLSRQMVLCLVRAIRFGRAMHPIAAREWLFPADSVSGHITEQKERRVTLSRWGNDLRQTFRTMATTAGVSEFDARLLMNHAIAGVNAGYITRHKLLEDHLRSQQQAISNAMLAAIEKRVGETHLVRWLGPGAAGKLAKTLR